jgi:tripartite-type tricarboxylate transporter receptor subunit TctC
MTLLTPSLWAMLITATASVLFSNGVSAQTWPARPVRIIVPFAPGGGVDTVSRLLAQKLTEQTGGAFVVENRAGGGGLVGADLVAKAAPDGYTLLTSAPEFSINPSVKKKMPFDALKDFIFVSQLTSGQFLLAAHPSVPVKSVRELIALAKQRPDRLNYGSSGTGSINHLAGELLQSMTGISWGHVPFKGSGPNLIGLMGGEIDFSFGSTTSLVDQARAGRVRGIAVTGSQRYAELPNVPTIAESGVPGYNVTGWYGLYAPAATPMEIVRKLHAETTRGFNSPEMRERLVKAGNDPVVSTPEAFDAFVRVEIAKWAKVVKDARLTLE